MAHAVRIWTLALCLTLLSAGIAFPQTSADVSPAATPTAAGVAYVYVGTTKGVYLYDAASNGKLTTVSGSPFRNTGLLVGSNGKYLFSLGTNWIHVYGVASNGAMKPQVFTLNTQNFLGANCGATGGAVLDHTGQNLYVLLNATGGPGVCAAYQTYNIAKSSGALTFNGAAVHDTSDPEQGAGFFAFTITGNDEFAYATNVFDPYIPGLSALQRESSGTLDYVTFNEANPTPPSGAPYYFPFNLTADPTNHLAIALEIPGGDMQLGSFTVDEHGNISSTNTSANMPNPHVYPTAMNMSPSGKFLAVATDFAEPGLQVFHFNGANPITSFSGVLTTAPIYEIHWDNNDHLYALSNSTNKLYAYTVTSSSITAVPGSPYTIASTPNALVVVPTPACSAPSSNGVRICAPTSGSTISSPVLVEAFSTVTGTIARMELWVDGEKKYTATSSKQLNTTISLEDGTHRFAVLAINTAGTKWESVMNATVE